jgi:hypothetical protein
MAAPPPFRAQALGQGLLARIRRKSFVRWIGMFPGPG